METIFVSIASYRDVLCSTTISDLYNKAKNPENIFVGICQQNKEDDTDCVSPDFQFRKNISIIKLKHTDAKGPTWARYICSTLYNGQDYFLQIDSHTLFAKDWDIKLINMIKTIQINSDNKNIILSHYPRGYEDIITNETDDDVTSIHKCLYNERGMISMDGARFRKKESLPTKNAFVAAGFIFAPSKWLQDVPFDPTLDYLFVGEEMLLAARTFTSGWDVFTPNDNIVYHKYTREKENKIWNDIKYSDDKAFEKTKIILKLKEIPENLDEETKLEIQKYGLGVVRPLEDFYKLIGFDINTRTCGATEIEFYKQPSSCYANNQYLKIISIIIFIIIFSLFSYFLYKYIIYRETNINQ